MKRVLITLFAVVLAIVMAIPVGVPVQADSPVTIHLGSGIITSTSLDTYGTTWGPGNDYWFDLSAGLKVTIVGLDMGEVPYKGAWGWPPVAGEDGGSAQLWVQDGYGNFSRQDLTSAGKGGTWNAQGTPVGHDQGFRKYLIQNFYTGWVQYGNSQYNVEPWQGPRLAPGLNTDGNMGTPNPESDKFDLEYTYAPGVGSYAVSGRSRMHYAASWDEMSLPKPPWPAYKWQWNKAINNSANADAAWVPFYNGIGTVPGFNGAANLRMAFQNRGVPQSGYWTISWNDIVVVGTPMPAAEVDASVSGGHGSVDPATQTVNYNAPATINITPDLGYHIASITDNGNLATIANPYVISSVTANHAVVVTFAIDTFAVSASVTGGHGSVTPATQTVNYGSNASINISPDTGYHIASITDNGNPSAIANPYVISRVTANHAVVVTFAGPQSSKQDVLNGLIALRATVTDKQDGNKLDEAIKHLAKSLTPSWWVDDAHLQVKEGEKVFNEEKDAVNQLRDLIKNKKSSIADTALQPLLDRIVEADRLLAAVAIADATGGDPKDIAKANEELGKGSAEATLGKYDSAIDHYRNAWKFAQKSN